MLAEEHPVLWNEELNSELRGSRRPPAPWTVQVETSLELGSVKWLIRKGEKPHSSQEEGWKQDLEMDFVWPGRKA